MAVKESYAGEVAPATPVKKGQRWPGGKCLLGMVSRRSLEHFGMYQRKARIVWLGIHTL